MEAARRAARSLTFWSVCRVRVIVTFWLDIFGKSTYSLSHLASHLAYMQLGTIGEEVELARKTARRVSYENNSLGRVSTASGTSCDRTQCPSQSLQGGYPC